VGFGQRAVEGLELMPLVYQPATRSKGASELFISSRTMNDSLNTQRSSIWMAGCVETEIGETLQFAVTGERKPIRSMATSGSRSETCCARLCVSIRSALP
jgi:hypothetical protein